MKVTKLDVSKKVVDVPDNRPFFYEVEHSRDQWELMKEGEMPSMMTVNSHERTYEIRKMVERDGTTNLYAIEANERGLWEVFKALEDGMIESLKRKQYEEGFWDGEKKGYKTGFSRAKLEYAYDMKTQPFLQKIRFLFSKPELSPTKGK